MSYRIVVFFTWVILASCTIGRSEEAFVLDNSFEKQLFPESKKALYIDSSAQLTHWQLTDDLFKDSISLNKTVIGAAHWYRFSLKNETDARYFIIEFPDPHVSEVEVYFKNGKESYTTGSTKIFETKNYKHKNFAFEIPVAPNQISTYYIRLKSTQHSDYGFKIWRHKSFSNYALSEYFFLGMFYGILTILAVYNLFLYFSIREKTYLYYVAYIITAGLHTFSEDGLGFQYVWPNFPGFNWVLSLFSFPFLLITFLLYSDSFISLQEKQPKIKKWVVISTIIYAVCFVYINFIGEPHSIIFFLYMIPYVLTYYAAIKIYKQGYKQARFFVFGFSIVLLSFLVFFLRVFLGLPGSLFVVYIFNFGFVLEAVMLSYALGDKIRITKNESEIAQKKVIKELERNEILKDKVNRELESKVKERTVELEETTQELIDANEELQSLRDKLYEMNSELDKANWKLQREVKEVVKSKILSESVDYEDFIKIFPDNLTCTKHLEKLKWGNGFKCKKCGYSQYTNTTKPFLRKCSNCKQPESVTAHTLFHAIKFPMNKAFYIAYFTCDNQKKMTIDELSELLDLRRNTAWMFKKKVEARIEEQSKKGNYTLGESWEKLVI